MINAPVNLANLGKEILFNNIVDSEALVQDYTVINDFLRLRSKELFSSEVYLLSTNIITDIIFTLCFMATDEGRSQLQSNLNSPLTSISFHKE